MPYFQLGAMNTVQGQEEGVREKGKKCRERERAKRAGRRQSGSNKLAERRMSSLLMLGVN